MCRDLHVEPYEALKYFFQHEAAALALFGCRGAKARGRLHHHQEGPFEGLGPGLVIPHCLSLRWCKLQACKQFIDMVYGFC